MVISGQNPVAAAHRRPLFQIASAAGFSATLPREIGGRPANLQQERLWVYDEDTVIVVERLEELIVVQFRFLV